MFSVTFISAKKVMFSVRFGCLSVCFCAWKQDGAKAIKPISINFGVRVKHGPRKNPFHFREDMSHRTDALI